jgi:hypothetical protein
MNKKIAVFILMLVAAVFVLVPLLSITSSLKLRNHGVKAEGTVMARTGKKGLSTVTVSFDTPEGKQIIAKASKRKYVRNGDKVQIYYDPEYPQKIDFGDTISYNMRGVVIGCLLFIIGFYYFIRYSIVDSANKKLITSGKKIEAELVTVARNEKYRMGDNNPWVIKCTWTDVVSNREYHFVSKDYTIDPAPYLKDRYHVDVFIDPSDPGRYCMDTSFMPKGNNTIG